MEKHLSFLLAVEKYITDNPECGAYVSQFVANGIEKARVEIAQRCTDFESALLMVLNRGSGRHSIPKNQYILEKLEKWKGKSSLNWESAIEDLEAKVRGEK